MKAGVRPQKLVALKRVVGESVLDVGCHNQWAKEYVKCNYVGIDILRDPKPNIRASATHLPFKDNSFDTVLLIDVIEHLLEPYSALLEAKRVARKKIILSVPEAKKANSLADPSHFYSFEKGLLFRLLKTIGKPRLLDLDPNTIFAEVEL